MSDVPDLIGFHNVLVLFNQCVVTDQYPLFSLPYQYIIGDGNNLYDFTYVENVAYAHICAERTLASEEGAKKAAGQVYPFFSFVSVTVPVTYFLLQAYFITNGEPIKFWEFMSLILEGLGYERYV